MRPATGLAPRRVLVARSDNAGDVLLTGPAVRAIAGAGDEVVFLASPQGAAAARLLPGVSEVLTHQVPWIDADPSAVDPARLDQLVQDVRARRIDRAAILVSSHQSPLPLALLLRSAGVGEIAAVSHDYAGSLLDHRIPGDPDLHEVERNLAVVAELGYQPAPGDSGRLAVDVGASAALSFDLPASYLVVHVGASVPARTLAPERWHHVVAALQEHGHRIVLTGGAAERAAVDVVVAGLASPVVDLAGRTSLAQLAAVLAGADAVVTGNTGPMHLAAAVGAPVVAVFPPTVRPGRWQPWGTRHLMLGIHDIACGDCRSRTCPLAAQPCLAGIRPADVVHAVDHLLGEREGDLVRGSSR